MEIDRMRKDAADLLSAGRAKLVIGYRKRGDRCVSALVTNPAGTADLVCGEECEQNLAAYLGKADLKPLRPVAIVARPAVMRSIVMLAAESQLADGEVIVLACGPDVYHGVLDVAGAAALLKEKYADLPADEEVMARIRELEAMTAAERAAFWTAAFEKCTRCHACRAACPACYCERCIVEKNVPQWISTAAQRHGNFAWNIIRAFHLAGRCTQCGACEAACPQGLPLMLLNVRMAMEAAEEFGYRPGYDPEAEPLVGTYNTDDDEEFIR